MSSILQYGILITISVLQHKKVLCVKEFRRSAAGEQLNTPSHLRPAIVLLQTTTYLLTKTTRRRDYPFTSVYDFVFDRYVPLWRYYNFEMVDYWLNWPSSNNSALSANRFTCDQILIILVLGLSSNRCEGEAFSRSGLVAIWQCLYPVICRGSLKRPYPHSLEDLLLLHL